ncbi:hypothetical protein QL285_059207 [Trifolium repens]|nr:hypothetical protein QL285_059207 [Trifolium repens]
MNHQREEQQPKRTKLKNRSIERSAMQSEESTWRNAINQKKCNAIRRFNREKCNQSEEVQWREVQCNQKCNREKCNAINQKFKTTNQKEEDNQRRDN